MKTFFRMLTILILCTSVPSIAQEIEKDPSKGALVKTYSISGSVGLPGVTMQGLPGNPQTDENGCYHAIISVGWFGMVTPTREGHVFEPPSRTYKAVNKDLTSEDYRAERVMLTISDQIAFHTDAMIEPIQEVIVTAEPGGYTDTTDSDGWYHVKVPYGWSGKLDYAKEDFAFSPSSIPFQNVTEDYFKGEAVSKRQKQLDVQRARSHNRYRQPLSPLSADEILVIPTREVDAEAFTQTGEDMRVMAHILREKLSEPRTIRGVLYDYGDFFGWPDREVEAINLQGYGVLFVVRVQTPFPLSQKPQASAQDKSEPPVDPVWQRARQTLRGMPSAGSSWPTQEDRMSFEQFKEDLLQTLKHATNIRHVDPNEFVILTVIEQDHRTGNPFSSLGPGSSFSFQGGAGSYATGSGFGGGYSSGGGSFYSYGGGSGQGPSRGDVAPAQDQQAPATGLTIQAVKADIDAFAKGQIDFEQFQAKTKVFSY